MSILQQIIASTEERVKRLKARYNSGYFSDSELFHSPTLSLVKYIGREDKNGIIAEFKRFSPSKGELNLYAKPEEVTLEYMRSGCSALSILTEPEFFKGNNEDLIKARKFNFCPILRKDFIIDPIQIFESRAIGADAILLIERVLSKAQISELKSAAEENGLEVLIELDRDSDSSKLPSKHYLYGINSRDLSSMTVDVRSLVELKNRFQLSGTLIAESGINSAKDVNFLRQNGFNGFLIGSKFMKDSNPGLACRDFCKQINRVKELVA